MNTNIGMAAPAQIAMGRSAENKGDNEMARGFYARAAQAGSVEALRLLATNLLACDPQVIPDGIAMMREAAHRGDAEAAHICAAIAANDDQLPNRWNIALDYLLRAAQLGQPFAQRQLSMLSGDDGSNWTAMRGKIEVDRWLSTPQSQSLSESPIIRSYAGFLPPQFCDWIIERSRDRTQPATVVMPETGAGNRMELTRNNSHAGFSLVECDVILMLTRARISALSGLPPQGLEWPMALHYLVGEEYKPHYDFYDTASPNLQKKVDQSGQRVATFLIYLNEDFDGGHTEFPKLDISFRGRKGDGLLFFNVENGKPDARTLHAGRAPTRGEKWLYSQWIREPKI
ncbi:MAG TPA: 2OG-Fe(II) oxygenase [Rhizomicrobium sp.]|nr:2OG-Fe(II) oxygenase [Rhizomicrobium sp.]